MAAIALFTDAHIRPGVVVVSTEPFEGENVEMYRAFDEVVERGR